MLSKFSILAGRPPHGTTGTRYSFKLHQVCSAESLPTTRAQEAGRKNKRQKIDARMEYTGLGFAVTNLVNNTPATGWSFTRG